MIYRKKEKTLYPFRMSLKCASILEELSLNCVKRVTRPFTESVLVEQPLPLLGSAGGQSDKITPASTSLCVTLSGGRGLWPQI